MSSDSGRTPTDPAGPAFAEGKRTGLAIGALAASAVAFVSLLGIEKAILGLALAALAARPHCPNRPTCYNGG